ncbi:hypothetical protein Pyrde_0047 [Pyrodictium delaneyi]|uniref:Uncharacterized protein n=1 Tax=Pyrodictium delaneyi TaxID=1273541 RepID=A0A0N7JCR1_9CREN|nr:hypothetical protein [Pyrodictium delaneyi]ALL00097.1 hypothetical protein Pyrde_0047 [Pyrodictium delaneyi]OWJ54737.1 hypothetical protein Pdsh_03140 [Pyrodictium delaneyi]
MVDLILCDRRVTWLTSVDRIVEDLYEGLKARDCRVEWTDGTLVASCRGCILRARVWAEDASEMVRALGALAEEAVKRGWGAVGLEVRISRGCDWLCEAVYILLMRGGG